MAAHQNRRFCLEALSTPNFPPHFPEDERLAQAKTDPVTSETYEKLRSLAHLSLGGPVFPHCHKNAPGNSQIGPKEAAGRIELTRANYSPRVRFQLSTENSPKIAHEELNISGPILRRSP